MFLVGLHLCSNRRMGNVSVCAVGLITELSQIEHRRILGRRAINCDCPRHSSVVLLICDFAH